MLLVEKVKDIFPKGRENEYEMRHPSTSTPPKRIWIPPSAFGSNGIATRAAVNSWDVVQLNKTAGDESIQTTGAWPADLTSTKIKVNIFWMSTANDIGVWQAWLHRRGMIEGGGTEDLTQQTVANLSCVGKQNKLQKWSVELTASQWKAGGLYGFGLERGESASPDTHTGAINFFGMEIEYM